MIRDLQIEQAVLGACLFDQRLVARAELRPEHFSDGVHQAIWLEMQDRYRDGRLIDPRAMAEWAVAHLPKELNGLAFLLGVMEQAAPLTRQFLGYAEMLRDMARRRKVIEAAKEAIANAEIGDSPGDVIQAALEQRLHEIAHEHADGDAWERLGQVACDAVERAQLGEAKGISTGFKRLDEITGGLQPGTLWVVGGASSMGKSVMGAALTRNIAAQGYGVGEVHLEMDALQIGLRTASALAFDADHRAVNPYYLSAQRGDLRDEQWTSMRGAAKVASRLPIYTDARPGRSLSQIEAAARRLFRRMEREGIKPGALLIDHEGLIAAEPGQRFPSQLERANARSEGLLALAKRLGVALIALSQITKEGGRADGEERMPSLHDLAYGSALSQAATVAILLHRKAYYVERKPLHLRSQEDEHTLRSREATLIVDKARGGRRAQIQVLMDMPTAAVWEEQR